MKQTILPIAMVFLFLAATFTNAKTTNKYGSSAQTISTGLSSTAATAAFESKFTPYFSFRTTHSTIRGNVIAPKDEDLFFLAKHWQLLSPSFKSLYLKATDLPSGWQTYDSPGGHFQIIYSLTGIDSVNKADSIGYSKDSWRIRQSVPNGIPDYVDEVAFAADSAWSMEVDRFGFNKPISYATSNYPSARYKILIRKFDDITESGYYGQTYPMALSGNGKGYSSYFELRSEWWVDQNWQKPGATNYTLYPENAARVTCMHEFFHSCQYAMIWQEIGNVLLDDFPIAWIEASAVLMENLGFDYINDFLQYVSSFFGNIQMNSFGYPPRSSMLTDGPTELDGYTNSIVTIYLYGYAYQQPGIGFIKDMFVRNFQNVTPFLNNLRASAASGGRNWCDILGAFFQSSYYTGSRALPNRFIAEASLVPDSWSYAIDGSDQNTSIAKNVASFGMNTFAVTNSGNSAGSLKIDFAGDSLPQSDTDTNPVWSVNCILKHDNIPSHDSLFSMVLSGKNKGNAVIGAWPNFKEALVITTNAKNDHTRKASVSFTTCQVSITKGKQGLYSAEGISSGAPNALVNVTANEDLFCDMTIARKSPTQQMTDTATLSALASSGTIYDISFPQTWPSMSSMSLTIKESYSAVMKIADTNKSVQSSFSIFQWDNTKKHWTMIDNVVSSFADSEFQWQCQLSAQGLYGVFGPLVNGPSPTVDVFPNPIHTKSGNVVKILGQNILEVWISTVDGLLISHGIKGNAALGHSLTEVGSGFWWKLTNNAGKPVSPGVYLAAIGYKDTTTKGMKKKIQKIFVLP